MLSNSPGMVVVSAGALLMFGRAKIILILVHCLWVRVDGSTHSLMFIIGPLGLVSGSDNGPVGLVCGILGLV